MYGQSLTLKVDRRICRNWIRKWPKLSDRQNGPGSFIVDPKAPPNSSMGHDNEIRPCARDSPIPRMLIQIASLLANVLYLGGWPFTSPFRSKSIRRGYPGQFVADLSSSNSNQAALAPQGPRLTDCAGSRTCQAAVARALPGIGRRR
jgi:hypothetical protein